MTFILVENLVTS